MGKKTKTFLNLFIFFILVTSSSEGLIIDENLRVTKGLLKSVMALEIGNDICFPTINKINSPYTFQDNYSTLDAPKEGNNNEGLNISLSTSEVSLYKYNETKVVYINVTDAYGFVNCNLTFIANISFLLDYDPHFAKQFFADRLLKCTKSISVGRWYLELCPYIFDYTTAGTYNVTIVASNDNYPSVSKTIIVHAKSYDHSPPIIKVIKPAAMMDCRENQDSTVTVEFIVMDDFWIRDVRFKIINGSGYEIYFNRPDEPPMDPPPYGDYYYYSNSTYAHIANFTLWPDCEGVTNVSFTAIDENYHFTTVNVPIIVDGASPRVKITSPKDKSTFESTKIRVEWEAEDYSGISKYEVYVSPPQHPNEEELVLETESTSAWITLPEPPQHILNATYCYLVTVYAYDIYGHAASDYVNVYIHIPFQDTTESTVDKDDNKDDSGLSGKSSSWFNKVGIFLLSGGAFAYISYKFFNYLSKNTINDGSINKKNKRKSKNSNKQKAKQHVTNWRKKTKR